MSDKGFTSSGGSGYGRWLWPSLFLGRRCRFIQIKIHCVLCKQCCCSTIQHLTLAGTLATQYYGNSIECLLCYLFYLFDYLSRVHLVKMITSYELPVKNCEVYSQINNSFTIKHQTQTGLNFTKIINNWCEYWLFSFGFCSDVRNNIQHVEL